MSRPCTPQLKLLTAFSVLTLAQADDEIYRIVPGIDPPRLLFKKEPSYTRSGLDAHIQGAVFLETVINENGRTEGIRMISPLGFGLDEAAQATIAEWRFAPATKDGKPVKVRVNVEVNFRMQGIGFDEKAERHRTSFNKALQRLNEPKSKPEEIESAVKIMQELSGQEFPPAMYAVGIWEVDGDHLTKNPEHGLDLITKAAAKNYGAALYEIGIRQVEGRDLARDEEKGLEAIRQSAVLGSPQAQFHLGTRYEQGKGVATDTERARRYFRLCAAKGIGLCEFRLANSLLNKPERAEREYVQAVAWLELAAEQGLADAKTLLTRETQNITPTQTAWVQSLKPKLVPK